MYVGYRDIHALLFKEYRKNARNRKLLWKLEFEYFKQLISQDCFYCGEPPSKTTRNECPNETKSNGIDRVDPALGYFKKNVVPCCRDCNNMKWNSTLEDFLKKVGEIYENAKKNSGVGSPLEN